MDKQHLIVSYLESLPNTDKAIVILRWSNEFSWEEIELILGIEKDEIMFRHKKLMLALKESITAAGETNGNSIEVKAEKNS